MKSLPVLLMAALLPNAAAAETIDVRSDSEQPTVIYGEAENANGTFNEMTVEQAADAQNPFGNPIVNELPYGKPAPEVEKGKPLPPAPELGKKSRKRRFANQRAESGNQSAKFSRTNAKRDSKHPLRIG